MFHSKGQHELLIPILSLTALYFETRSEMEPDRVQCQALQLHIGDDDDDDYDDNGDDDGDDDDDNNNNT